MNVWPSSAWLVDDVVCLVSLLNVVVTLFDAL